jgi:uncharacterized protein GlcG (DUF336 family)
MPPADRSTTPRRRKPTFRAFEVEALESRLAMSVAPISGDWDGDLRGNVGLYDNATGLFALRTGANTSGTANVLFNFGPTGNAMRPVVGDWDGDGKTTPGVYNTTNGQFTIRSTNTAGPGQTFAFVPPGTNKTPISGDWDANGQDSIGIYDVPSGTFYLRNSNTAGPVQNAVALGPSVPGWSAATAANFRPIVGDFKQTGHDGLGLYNVQTGVASFLYVIPPPGGMIVVDTKPIFDPAQPNVKGATPVVGDWNVDGFETLGLYRTDNSFALRDAIGSVNSALTTLTLLPVADGDSSTVLTSGEVDTLLRRAAAASKSENAIIAIVDRQGRILGVRVEKNVPINPADKITITFAIDGAVALARTGAFFANGLGPLTSRTVEVLSQSTITQREVQSNPNIPGDTVTRGPGTVGVVGVGGHFPSDVNHTPSADLFGIEHTNRDSLTLPGPDGTKGTADDIKLDNRFNASAAFVAAGKGINAPESYGTASGLLPNAQARGIGTLPGGIPLYKNGVLVGGIGVFFPGTKGYADFEQGFKAGVGQTIKDRMNAPMALEAEWIAFAAAGGFQTDVGGVGLTYPVGTINGVPLPAGFGLPLAQINLAGITLDLVGPNGIVNGLNVMTQTRNRVGLGDANSGVNMPVTPAGATTIGGYPVPTGWLVTPHDAAPGAGTLTKADVVQMINAGINEANLDRAQIRLRGNTTRMVFSVADMNGNVLGLYRMPDATYFSIDVAVAKARNTAYYASAQLQDVDQLEGIPKGTAFSNRTFRYIAQPYFPEGTNGAHPAPFSSLNEVGLNSATAENVGAAQPYSVYAKSKFGFIYDSFNVGTNFHQQPTAAQKGNQNGVVWFPGSTPVYKTTLVGGLGVSGDGVDQDDIVTYYASSVFQVPATVLKIDQTTFDGLRLPYYKFPRNPHVL